MAIGQDLADIARVGQALTLGDAQERLPDANINLDACLVIGEYQKLVGDILSRLSELDRELFPKLMRTSLSF